ncbi:MAG: hypothetical protein HY260_10575 [Chloroflexi bacterium]|nr:hypothetical protein [Chloroflexota bacterium]
MAVVILDHVQIELTAEHLIAAIRQLPPDEWTTVMIAIRSEGLDQKTKDMLERLQKRSQTRAEGKPK